jgi:hypothetical protein
MLGAFLRKADLVAGTHSSLIQNSMFSYYHHHANYHKTDGVCIHAEEDPQRVESVCHGAVIGPATFDHDPSRAGRANPCRQLALPNLSLAGC